MQLIWQNLEAMVAQLATLSNAPVPDPAVAHTGLDPLLQIWSNLDQLTLSSTLSNQAA